MMRRPIEIFRIDILNCKLSDGIRLPPHKAAIVRSTGYEQSVLLCNIHIVLYICTVIGRIEHLNALDSQLYELLYVRLIIKCLGITKHGNSARALDDIDELLGSKAEVRNIRGPASL